MSMYRLVVPLCVLVFLSSREFASAQRVRPLDFWSAKEQENEINDGFVFQRMLPEGRIDAVAHQQAAKSWIERRANQLSSWRSEGPVNTGGRLTDVEMPASSLTTIYACAATGGIFKSVDDGNSWTPIFDNQPSLSIGDLSIAPSNDNVLYAGTGESNAGGGSLTYDGAGVFKSTDAGASWTYAGLSQTRNIGRIAIDPVDPDVVYVAAMGDLFANTTSRGLYRSTDGGNSWQSVLYVNDSTGAVDVVIDPVLSSHLFACTWTRVRRINRRNYGGPASGLWESHDGGTTWTCRTGSNGLPSAFNYGRTSIGIAASNPSVLYYMISNQQSVFQGVYRSTDGGNSWSRTNDSLIGDVFNGSAHWEGRIKIDPSDANTVYLIGYDTWKTTDGGLNWYNISSSYHPDNHEVFIHPLQHDHLLRANDGGLFVSDDGGNSWTQNLNLPVNQFYACDVDESDPLTRAAGAQDNGVVETTTGLTDDWFPILGGDGFQVLIDPRSGFTYAEYQYGGLNTGTNGVDPSDRFNWNTPLAFNPVNYSTAFLGTNRLYRTRDQGNSWSVMSPDLTSHSLSGYPITWGTITAIAVAPADTSVIYCGTDDGNVWVTLDDGISWQQVNPMPVERWVTRLTVDPIQAGTVYATLSGYRFNDPVAHVYKSTNFGAMWLPVDSGLPDIPCNDLVIDPGNTSNLYVATDAGVYFSDDAGITWNATGSGLPAVPVTDLRFHQPTRTLYAATYGRSLWSYPANPISTGTNSSNGATENLITLFPNPATNRLFVYAPDTKGELYHVTLSDSEGNVFKVLDTRTHVVDLSECITSKPAGCYFVTLTGRTFTATRRLLKLF